MSSAGYVTISTFVEKEDVVLAVQDEGHGIESNLLDKIGTSLRPKSKGRA